MTVFFVRPLLRLGSGSKKINWKASRLNEVALRTLVASVVCLIASFANIFTLVMFDGRERGLVCLTCCTVDVTINVTTVHWVTSHTPGKRMKDNMDYSTNQRESNPEYSGYQRSQTKDVEPQFIVHHSNDNVNNNASDHHLHDVNDDTFNFSNTNRSNIPPYNSYSTTSNVTRKEKCDDLESTDSNFLASSLHESHNSRKSLTKL
ncbi:hypothetical protein INT47_003316 [Mucor saturninus]|uniref:Uncharacterized protein n=1 Tax=Mucor saturninus TaxID=64648 RepID=A0A8H7RIL6_9FUNG|nr:hypothetical protein INT47_003316 [Mucor saturninus]